MKKIFICTTMLLVTLNSFGQLALWDWVKKQNAGGSDNEYAKSITSDAMGNTYILGSFASKSITLGSYVLTNKYSPTEDIYIAKYDSQGNVLWAKSAGSDLGDYGQSIDVDNFGNIFIAGFFRSYSISFGTINLYNYSSSNGDYFIAKYDAAGNVLWAKNAVNGTSSDAITSISTDKQGNVYATGHFQSASITFGSTTLTNPNAPSQEMFIAKFDGAGNVLWAKSGGGTGHDIGVALSADTKGNIFLTGTYKSPSVSIGGTVLVNCNAPNEDVFIAKYDSLGNVIWAKTVGGLNSDYSLSIATDLNGCVIIGGGFNSNAIKIDTEFLVNNGGNRITLYLAKFSPSGNVIWARSIANSSSCIVNAICTDGAGNIYATGHFQDGKITFGITSAYNSSTPNQEVFVVQYSANGNPGWLKAIAGAGNDVGRAITIDNSGNVFVFGEFASPTIKAGESSITNASSKTTDFFIAKISTRQTIYCTKKQKQNYDELNENTTTNTIAIYPSPASDYIVIETNTPSDQNEIISIYNIQGQLVHEQVLLEMKSRIDVSNLTKGIYIVHYNKKGNHITKKFIKE